MGHEEVVRRYGPWRPRTPADAAALFRGYPRDWWIAGGWAIEAFTGGSRPHDDIDPGIPRGDEHLLREHVRDRLDVWAADRGVLRPLFSADTPTPATCRNLWLRRDDVSAWEYDILLTDTTGERWVYRRDPRVTRLLADILWRRDGLRYLRPEVQLLYKAPALRVKDQEDFDACLPLLHDDARVWLREALQTAHEGHPWIPLLE